MTSSAHNTEQLLEHGAWIRELARQLVGHGLDHEDLVQDTWLAALRHQPDGSDSLRPWLARVLRNLAREAHRRRAARGDFEPLGDASNGTATPEEILARGETQARLVQEVLALREPFRSTLILRYYEGQPPAQIARTLGVPAATVRVRLKRGVDELRLRLDGSHGGSRKTWMLACLPLATGRSSILVSLMLHGKGLKWCLVASVLLATLGGSYWLALEPDAGEREVVQLELPSLVQELSARAEPTGASSTARREATSLTTAPLSRETPSWSAQLVDRVTAEPVPHYLMHVKQEGAEEALHSDEGGFFEVQMALQEGPFNLWLRDAPGVPRHVVHDLETGENDTDVPNWSTRSHNPSGAPETLAVRVGPTYSLILSGAGSPLAKDLRALLSISDAPGGPTVGGRIPIALREGPRPWVRFGPLPDFYEDATLCRLELQSTDGYWAGESGVDSISGIHPGPIAVQIEALGRIVGRVQASDGGTISRCSVTLERMELDPQTRQIPCSSAISRTRDGSFQFEYLAEGNYRLSCIARGYEPLERLVDVRALATEVLLIELEREREEAVSGGLSIRGLLRSATGEYKESVVLVLHGVGGYQEVMPGQWRRVGESMQAAYEFTGLEPGSYELSVSSFFNNFQWSPAQTVEAPARAVDFWVQDDVPTLELQFDVRSGESGQVIEPFQLGWSTNGGGVLVRNEVPADVVHISAVPTDARVDWAIHAPGYATSYGDVHDFSLTAEGAHVARVELDRGWRARLLVLHGPENQLAVGAGIYIDGQLVATTDEQGFVTLQREAAPVSIGIRHAGKQTTRSTFSPAMPWTTIRLK